MRSRCSGPAGLSGTRSAGGVAARQRSYAHEFPHILLAEATQSQADLREREHSGQAVSGNPRHGFEPERLERTGKAPQQPGELPVGIGVARADTIHGVLVQDDVLAVRAQPDRALRFR